MSKFIIVLNTIKRKQIFKTWRTQPVLQVVKHVFKFYRKQWDAFHMANFFATVTVNFICMIGDRLATNGTVRHDTNSLGWKAWQEQKYLNDNLIFRIAELHKTIKEIQWEQLNWVNLWIVFINLVRMQDKECNKWVDGTQPMVWVGFYQLWKNNFSFEWKWPHGHFTQDVFHIGNVCCSHHVVKHKFCFLRSSDVAILHVVFIVLTKFR